MGHRRFLPASDSRRKQKALFDNTIEKGSAPRILTGRNIYALLKDYPNDFGKEKEEKSKKRKCVYDTEDEDDNTNDSTKMELSRWKRDQFSLICLIGRLVVSLFIFHCFNRRKTQ